jgi:hypothetical protein
MIAIQVPTSIPVGGLACMGVESSQNVQFGCTIIISNLPNRIQLELSYGGPSPMSIYQLTVSLKSISSGVATITSN